MSASILSPGFMMLTVVRIGLSLTLGVRGCRRYVLTIAGWVSVKAPGSYTLGKRGVLGGGGWGGARGHRSRSR